MKEDPEATRERTDMTIRNTYRTLLTRGMKGTYVYCTDDGMRDHLREQLAIAGARLGAGTEDE
jgi:DUF2075 family protein